MVQLDEPADCVWLFDWLVFATFSAALTAPLTAVWFALDEPPVMFPPATFTGAFELTAFWEAVALERAACRVVAV
jgi:hypothetical protein